jgi:hypothetical protein|tara:strand:- start:1534 stop:1683 length:150 start_codon:yes stop_codon:yes gene_type:complete
MISRYVKATGLFMFFTGILLAFKVDSVLGIIFAACGVIIFNNQYNREGE